MVEIWKFPIPEEIDFEISMPEGSKVLSVQLQRGMPVMWAAVNPAAKMVMRKFRIALTGKSIPAFPEHIEAQFIGTFQLGGFVLHLLDPMKSR